MAVGSVTAKLPPKAEVANEMVDEVDTQPTLYSSPISDSIYVSKRNKTWNEFLCASNKGVSQLNMRIAVLTSLPPFGHALLTNRRRNP